MSDRQIRPPIKRRISSNHIPLKAAARFAVKTIDLPSPFPHILTSLCMPPRKGRKEGTWVRNSRSNQGPRFTLLNDSGEKVSPAISKVESLSSTFIRKQIPPAAPGNRSIFHVYAANSTRRTLHFPRCRPTVKKADAFKQKHNLNLGLLSDETH